MSFSGGLGGVAFTGLKRETIMRIKKTTSTTQLVSILCDVLMRISSTSNFELQKKNMYGMNDINVMSYLNSRLLRAPSSLYTTRYLSSISGQPSSKTLKQIIIVHRHGARFPNKKIKGDLSWPTNETFWSKYKAQLTPVGTRQLLEIGQNLRNHYINHTSLFKGIAESDISDYVVVRCSNTNRTLFSSWSLLQGMFPHMPACFAFKKDRIELNIKDIRAKAHAGGFSLGIPIVVEDQIGTDKLFHQYKVDPSYIKWRKNNLIQIPLLKRLCKEDRYFQLADKLYKMTGLSKLKKSVDPIQRILAFKTIHTHLLIAKTHNLPMIPNVEGLSITSEEEEMIKVVAHTHWGHCFRSATSNDIENGKGIVSAGFLAHDIQRHMCDRLSEGENGIRMVEYSCHDGTIGALSARLGIDVPQPCFGGYFLFELHDPEKDGESKDIKPFVRMFYNPTPDITTRKDLTPLKLSLDGKCKSWDDLPIGSFLLEDFANFCQVDAHKIASLAFRKFGSMSVFDRLGNYKGGTRRFPDSDYELVFNSFTKHGADILTKGDLTAALRTFGIHQNPDRLDKLFKLIDADNSGSITLDEFIFMVDAFVPDNAMHAYESPKQKSISKIPKINMQRRPIQTVQKQRPLNRRKSTSWRSLSPMHVPSPRIPSISLHQSSPTSDSSIMSARHYSVSNIDDSPVITPRASPFVSDDEDFQNLDDVAVIENNGNYEYFLADRKYAER